MIQVDNTVTKDDIERVARSMGKEGKILTPAEIDEVIERYPTAQDEDQNVTWNFVVEDLIYQVINERPKK